MAAHKALHAARPFRRLALAAVLVGLFLMHGLGMGHPPAPALLGRCRVYPRAPGCLPDVMHFSGFFSGGYAIPGFNPAAGSPASHGCMRVPIVDAISIYNWLTYGDGDDVYYR